MDKENKSWGIASLVLGILSLLLVFMPYFGLPAAIVALVGAYKQNQIKPNGMATAGNILGILGCIFNTIMLGIVLIVLLVASAY
jgi:hypothetical protein